MSEWEPEVEGTYTIAGRGLVISTRANREMSRDHAECMGEVIRYNGEPYTIVGVERTLLNRPIRKGEAIGLLIRPTPKPNPQVER